ncbi:MAG TPA: DAK2 domain-containing protein, partial [Jatrophihabitantaceae bacterium]|nr:DAK2 domain-containing protein [Jatrophihabitantaceae bacterium]
MLDALDADAVRRWSRVALESMRAHQAEIDAINVFPVPDADTGTNLLLTLLVADDAVRAGATASAGAVLADLSRAAVLGARGNSGVIVSQVLRGFAEAAEGTETIDAKTFCRGLRRGAELADAAVAQPVDGTILTVAHAAAAGVADARGRS